MSGREIVLQALVPAGDDPGVIGRSGVAATALSSSNLDLRHPLKSIDPKDTRGGLPVELTLKDGTRVGGLLFTYDDGKPDPKPLLMASFGFLQDRWGSEAAKFRDLYLQSGPTRLPAHVLIVDHPSASPFLARNGCLSMGSYDDARMWIEIAAQMRRRLKISRIHLFGVSMSAQTVVHALIEDTRLGLNLFASGMAVSIAPDFQKAPGKQLAQLETAAGLENPWVAYFKGVPPKTLTDEIQCTALWLLIKNQFIPHYRYVGAALTDLDLKREDLPIFLRRSFETRISHLRAVSANDPSWNHADVRLENLDAYMASTRIAGILDRVRTPLVLVSAYDDPAVERAMFVELLTAAEGNSWIAAYETRDGGHFGFDMAYGADYLGHIIRLMMNPRIWQGWKTANQ